MTRVLWLTPNKPGNISVGRQLIASHLEATGVDVTLRAGDVATLKSQLASDESYDVVVGTTRSGAIVGTAVSTAKGIPFVVDHVDPIQQFYETESRAAGSVVERLENISFRRASHVFYVYPEEEARIRTRAESYSKTDLGVDYQRFAEPSDSAIASARNRIGDISDSVAVYVGGLEPIYHIDAMLEAVEYLDGWTLLVAGAGSLEPKVEAAGRQSAPVRYLGAVPHEDIPGYLALSDVGIALVDDPHTLKVLEYGAAGLPVVQLAGRAESRFGGLVTYCDTDPESIASMTETARQAETGAALQRYVSHFDWRRIAEEYARVIKTVK